MSPIDKLISTLEKEEGYLEKASNAFLDDKTSNVGSNNWTKYARDMDLFDAYNSPKNGYSWCDMFVDWGFVQSFGFDTAMEMTYQPVGGNGAGCTGSANYYKANKQFFSTPKVGDQIFFKGNGNTFTHTGIVIKIEGGRVYTIEGNTSSKEGVIANGGGVFKKSYPLNYAKIGGYGRPNYALVAEEEEMTLEQFKAMLAEVRKESQDNDSSTYSKEAREWAIKSGLIQGNGTINGEPNYLWKDQISREQFVTMLHRFAKMIGEV